MHKQSDGRAGDAVPVQHRGRAGRARRPARPTAAAPRARCCSSTTGSTPRPRRASRSRARSTRRTSSARGSSAAESERRPAAEHRRRRLLPPGRRVRHGAAPSTSPAERGALTPSAGAIVDAAPGTLADASLRSCASPCLFGSCWGRRGRRDADGDAATPTHDPATAKPSATTEPTLEESARRRSRKYGTGRSRSRSARCTLPPPCLERRSHDPAELLHTGVRVGGERCGIASSTPPAHALPARASSRSSTAPCARSAASRAARRARSTARAAHGVYLNTTFFDGLARQYGLRSGFAAGYITAHEVAHHVQEFARPARARRGRRTRATRPAPTRARSLVELQADCYAGIWLHTRVGARRADRGRRAGHHDRRDRRRRRLPAQPGGRGPGAPRRGRTARPAQRVQWVMTGLQQGLRVSLQHLRLIS